MKIQLIAVLSLAFATALPIHAQEKPKASPATVEELLKVMKIERTLDSMWKSMDGFMDQSMQQALKGKNLPPEALAKSKEISNKVFASMKEELSPEKMKDMFVSVYSDVFTEDEVRAIIDFYKTPAGQAFIDKQPLVMQRTMAFMQEKMGVIMPKIQAAAEESVKEAEAKTGK